MSADNGVYILETQNSEYRIKHLQVIDNVNFDEYFGEYTEDDTIRIQNAREMWRDCKVFTNRDDAIMEAGRIYKEIIEDDDCGICEYGINTIFINRKF